MNAETLRADDPVVLPHVGSSGRLWAAVLDVADQRAHGWTLVGALMVMLHEHEAGTPTRPATADADAVVDARGATGATRTPCHIRAPIARSVDTSGVRPTIVVAACRRVVSAPVMSQAAERTHGGGHEP